MDETATSAEPGPLHGLRVVELAGGVPAAFCARQLRGFGAETIRVEGVDGAGPGPTCRLTADQRVFLVAGARRLVVTGDELAELLDAADVVVEDGGPGFLASLGLDPEVDRAGRPHRVVTSISPFGHTGPRADWQTTNAVQFAVGGLMTLTGEPHRAPLVTGGEQAYFLGGLHAFAATAVAALRLRRHGRGAWIDLSMQEAAASMPELYAASSEYDLGEPIPRSGNSIRAVWGVYRCADGFAGVCCLERQVRAFFELLGEPVVGDPRFADPLSRVEHDDELLAHVLGFMAERTKDELAALSPVHRVPLGAVRTPGELLDDEAFAIRGFFDRVATPEGTATVPGRPFPGLGWAPADRLSEIGTGDTSWRSAGWADDASPAGPASVAPLQGVRVLDLTMMWAGPYATKLLAESGAEVIKVESPSAWDNIRTLVPQDPSIPDPWNSAYYFNEYNHSKKSLTLDLATGAGREVFLRLVATADVVIENYRADVLDKLGLGYEVLRAARDDIVLVSMAGFGKTGPLAHHVGFGPIIEMMSGLMSLTGYGEDGGYADDVPVKTGVSYGDPVGGLNAVAATVLSLIDRDRTGRGRHIDLAQRETASTMAGPAFVAASLRGEEPVHRGNRDPRHVPQGCYPAAGDDAWVVVSVRSDDEWATLARHLGRDDLAGLDLGQRTARHDELDELIGAWTAKRSADETAALLQHDGVPAGEVIDTLAIHDDPQLVARHFYRVVPNDKMHPYRQTGPTWAIHGPPAHEMRRSPWFGEHNAELLAELGLSDEERAGLVADQVIADAPINPSVG
jgi:crotonobetainyl-CoA:carnitine CoA-transferase CaiB-like acyl-CoA transferase